VNRAIALLLAAIGGAAVALFTAMLFGGALLGVLWLFVFGDDPWPASAEIALNIALPVLGLFLWAVFGWQIWLRLRRAIS
jgi:hypothetical protein